MAESAETPFRYNEAFARNLGWVTPTEQQVLRGKRVAIAGLGGVGGIHLLTLARLGIGSFSIADFDRFDLANFNRQVGATMKTLGAPKVEVLTQMVRDINPEIDVDVHDQAINKENVNAFLKGADIYVDGLDFFAFDARQTTFAACHKAGIPAITVAPLGMGAALLNFLPGRMTFEEYFRVDNVTDVEKRIRFLVGLSPSMLQRKYLVDRSFVDLAHQRGPSTVMACQLCAGVAATEALKILLQRGKIHAAPVGLHYDAYRGILKKTWRPWGNRNPIQRIALAIARRQFGSMERRAGMRESTLS